MLVVKKEAKRKLCLKILLYLCRRYLSIIILKKTIMNKKRTILKTAVAVILVMTCFFNVKAQLRVGANGNT